MRIEHNGTVYPFPRAWTWLAQRQAADTMRRQTLDAIVNEGLITTDAGHPLPEPQQSWMKRRLTGAHEGRKEPSAHTLGSRSRPTGPRRMLVPGLWPWGHMPSLTGPQKVGKSNFVTGELVPALVVPDFRLFDHFEAAQISPAERGLGIWVINAETPPEDYEAPMQWLRDVEVPIDGVTVLASDLVTVWHLQEHGGPGSFDVTDPVKYQVWADLLADCEECDEDDFIVPFAVIVDGVTAILGGTTDRYAEWDAAFRRLMHSYDVPNALWVGHSTMQGNHSMGGVEALGGPDGLWLYSSDNADRATTTRRFWTLPRLGGVPIPPTVVRLDPDGRMRFDGSAPASTGALVQSEDYRAQVHERLDSAGAAGLLRKEVTGEGREGVARRAELNALIEGGEVVERDEPTAGRGNPRRCWLAEHAPPAD